MNISRRSLPQQAVIAFVTVGITLVGCGDDEPTPAERLVSRKPIDIVIHATGELGQRAAKIQEEIARYSDLLKNSPDDTDALSQRAAARVRLSNYAIPEDRQKLIERAIEDYRRAGEIANVPVPFVQASYAADMLYRFDEAADVLAKAARLAPDDLRVRTAQAWGRGRRDNKWEEVEALLLPLHRQPEATNLPELMFATGYAYHMAGKPMRAELGYRRAIELGPDNMHAKACLEALLLQTDREADAEKLKSQMILQGQFDPPRCLNRSIALEDEGRIAEAIAMMRDTLMRAPLFPAGWYRLGEMYFYSTRQYAEARNAYAIACQMSDDDPRLLDGFGQALISTKEFDEAKAVFTRMIELAPKNARGHYGLGRAYHALGKYTEAATAFRRAVELNPDNAKAWRLLGDTLIELARFPEATAATQRAAELEPDNAYALNTYAVALDQGGKQSEAVEVFRRAHRADTDWRLPLQNLTTVLWGLGRFAESIQPLTKFLAQHPDDTVAKISLQTAQAITGQFPAVIQQYDRIVEETGPKDVQHSLCYRGVLRYLNGDTDEAVEDLRAALECDTPSEYAALFVWPILTEAGEPEEAERVLRGALARVPEEAWSRQLLLFALGESTATEIVERAQGAEQRCEAEYYVGEQARLAHGIDAAEPHYRACLDTKMFYYTEYLLAHHRMGSDHKSPPRD